MSLTQTASLQSQTDRAAATVVRNLLLYTSILYLFAFQAPDLLLGTGKDRLDPSSEVGNLFNQLIVPVIFFATCGLVYACGIPRRRLWNAVLAMSPLLLLIVLSATWSEYPELTIRRAVREVMEAGSLAMLAACFSNPKVMLALLFRALLMIGCLDLLSAVVFPNAMTPLGFAGIHGHKNLAGQFFVVALPVYLMGTLDKEVSGNRLLGFFALASSVAMLVLTQSKTSIGAIIAGLAVLALARGLPQRHPAFRAVILLSLLLGLLCAVAIIVSWGPNRSLEILIGDPTLTGRDQIWRYATSKFEESPIVGAGYGAIWQVGLQVQLALKALGLYFVFNEAHNGYLDIAAQLGSFGVVCLLIFLVTTLLKTLSYWAKVEQSTLCGAGALTIYIFWALVISNVTESLYFQPGVGSSGILIFLAAFVANRSNRFLMISTASVRPRLARPYTT